MSTLVVPIACWQRAPQARPTCATAANDGEVVVVALESGAIVVYTWLDHFDEFRRQLVPSSLSIGHQNAVSALVLAKIELDEVALKQNVVVSGSLDGEVAMWDLEDGRCLQTNSDALETAIRGIHMSSSGRYLLCHGYDENIVVLDASSLETAQVLALPDGQHQWIASMSVYPTENASVDHLVVATFDGRIHRLLFNQETVQLTVEAAAQHISGPPLSLPLLVEHNRFDKRLVLLLWRNTCSILHLSSTGNFETIVGIECPSDERAWKSARFLSARSIALVSIRGTCHVVYLGPETDLSVVSPNNVDADTIVLFADSTHAVCVDRMEIGAGGYRAYSSAIFIGHMKMIKEIDDDGGAGTNAVSGQCPVVCFIPSNPSVQQSQVLLHLEPRSNSGFIIHLTHFWASLFGSNISRTSCATSSKSGIALSPVGDTRLPSLPLVIFPKHKYAHEEIWPTDCRSGLSITASALVLRKYVALGRSDGTIVIFPLAAPLAHEMAMHSEEHLRVLRGHRGSVTALFVPSFRVDGVRDRLLSGSDDGTVKLWNADTGASLGSFVAHAMPVLSFAPLPSDPGNKLRSAVVSIGMDNSVCVIDVDEAVVLYRFVGHCSPVISVHLGVPDDIIVVECVDGTLYLWQTRTQQLERIVSGGGAAAGDVLATCDVHVPCRQTLYPYATTNLKRTISVYSVTEPPPLMPHLRRPMLLVYQVNIKRLIDDIANGEHIITPVMTRKVSSGSGNGAVSASTKAVSGSESAGKTSSSKPMTTLSHLFKHGTGFLTADSQQQQSRQSRGYQLHQTQQGSSLSRPSHLHRSDSGSGSPTENYSVGGRSRGTTLTDANNAPASPNISAQDAATNSSRRSRPAAVEPAVVFPVFSAILSWGSAPDIDRICLEKIGLVPPASYVTVGFRGAGGYISFPVPPRACRPFSEWVVSSTMTAARLLEIMALSRSILTTKDFQSDIIQILTHYGVLLHKIVGPSFRFPSFSYLAKFWQDPTADVQESARTLFESTIGAMSEHDRAKVVHYWGPYLPSVCKRTNKMSMRAAIILGIMGSGTVASSVAISSPTTATAQATPSAPSPTGATSNSNTNSALDIRTCKEVAETLDMIVREESRETYRLIAIELVGRGFAAWEPHINAAALLRTLVGLTGLISPVQPLALHAPVATSGSGMPHLGITAPLAVASASSSGTPAGVSPLLAAVTSSHSYTNGGGSIASSSTPPPTASSLTPPPAMARAASNSAAAVAAALGQAAAAAPSTPPMQSSNLPVTLTPALMLMARQAVVNIASVNAGLFISTLTFDLVHARAASDRSGSLKLLGMFITKKPTILYAHLPRIVDAMVKTLDPNTPHVRESLQHVVTVNFAELVRTFPCIAFHSSTQRLAVGSPEGAVIVYDLRTATKAFLLEGHSRSVHAVSFSSDGRLIATFSAEENIVKIWQPQSGFLGTLVGALSGTAAGTATGAALATVSGAGHLKCFRSFHAGPPQPGVSLSSVIRDVRFVWTGDRAVKICSIGGLELTFNV